MIKALKSVQAQLVKIPGLTDEQVEQIQAIITKNTQPKIKGTGKKTGYILFSMTERKKLKEAGELDGLAFGEVARLLGKNWRDAEQSVRDSWNAQAKAQNPEPVKPQPANVEHANAKPKGRKAGRKAKGGGKPKSESDESDSEY